MLCTVRTCTSIQCQRENSSVNLSVSQATQRFNIISTCIAYVYQHLFMQKTFLLAKKKTEMNKSHTSTKQMDVYSSKAFLDERKQKIELNSK